MAMRIGIEPTLTTVRNFLEDKGFQVDTVSANSLDITSGYDAFVVTGLNSNMLGINDTGTNAVIINASGMTPDQVYREQKTRVK